MPTNDTFAWERDVLGEHIVYPSHPIVLACMIMDRYQNLAHATRNDSQDKYGFPNASSDHFIPGAGCAVRGAMRALEIAATVGSEAAFTQAYDYIENYRKQNVANEADAARAHLQCEKVKDRFVSHLAVWGTPDMPTSAVRLPDNSASSK